METEVRRQASLSALLRERRRQVDADTTTLGAFQRHPQRIGKRVTQEEVAEAVGVSRVWYALLESTVQVNASLALLQRLADVLMFEDGERVALFSAAMPGSGATR